MKTILVPTDFSVNANDALKYALALAKETSAKLKIISVTPLPHFLSGVSHDFTIKELKNLQNKIKKDPKTSDVDCKCYSKQGDVVNLRNEVVNMIKDFVKKYQVDFIVMGAKGASLIQEVVLGSITEAVIQKIAQPVLVIPANVKFEKVNKIVLAADYVEINGKSVLDPLIKLSGLFNAEVEILNVINNSDDVQPKLDKAVAGVKLDGYLNSIRHSFYFIANKSVINGINEFVEDEDAGMLALITQKRNLFDRIFGKGSIAGKLAVHTAIPLLALNNKQV